MWPSSSYAHATYMRITTARNRARATDLQPRPGTLLPRTVVCQRMAPSRPVLLVRMALPRRFPALLRPVSVIRSCKTKLPIRRKRKACCGANCKTVRRISFARGAILGLVRLRRRHRNRSSLATYGQVGPAVLTVCRVRVRTRREIIEVDSDAAAQPFALRSTFRHHPNIDVS
jgi:hypothetical protein